jgi:hypothetical protein
MTRMDVPRAVQRVPRYIPEHQLEPLMAAIRAQPGGRNARSWAHTSGKYGWSGLPARDCRTTPDGPTKAN